MNSGMSKVPIETAGQHGAALYDTYTIKLYNIDNALIANTSKYMISKKEVIEILVDYISKSK